MDGMDFNTVKACLLADFCRIAASFYDGMDLIHGQFPAHKVLIPVTADRGGGDGGLSAEQVRFQHTAEAGSELSENFGAVSVDTLTHFRCVHDKCGRVVRGARHGSVHCFFNIVFRVNGTCDDEAHTAFGPCHIVFNSAFVKCILSGYHTAGAHGCHHISVFQGTACQLVRLK